MIHLSPITVAIFVTIAVIAFIIGLIVAYQYFTKHLGELDAIKQQHDEWIDRLDNVKNELWTISKNVERQKEESAQEIANMQKDVETHKQEAIHSINDFKQKKVQATNAITKINTVLTQKQQALQQLEKRTKDLQSMESRRQEIEAAYEKISNKKQELKQIQVRYDELKSELSLYSTMESYIAYGLFPLPAYGETSSGAYNEKLKMIRNEQKAMVKNASAYTAPENIEITGNVAHDKKLLKNQGHLIITAFNSECDYLISKINSKNYEATMTKIEKLAEQLEKRLVSLEIGISLDYVELKMQECTVYYQYICQKLAEAEEQREIRAQIREETAAQREIEKALREAKKEEQLLQQAMEKARRELANASAEQKQKYETQLQELTEKLADAEAREKRAISMAQQTKRGHVYVISNIGSFGEDIYKIGMTRRLEPLDRVKELGDASVPFSFDIHAMIYSDDAPALEKDLHDYFKLTSVNKVNNRKEFFEVTLQEIRSYIEQKGLDTHWTMLAEATEYRQSITIAEQQMKTAA